MDIQQALYPNFTLFVQAGLFLVFVFLVNYLFVRPYTRVIEERDSITERSLQEAKKLKEEAIRLLMEASKILEDGKRESNALLERARKEAEKLKAEILQKVEAETQQEIFRAVEEIRKALEEEKAKLEGKVEEIAKLIRDKLLEDAA
ncbi:MAG: ATP synthase F0 subunit B [Hydrogenobacter sp.]